MEKVRGRLLYLDEKGVDPQDVHECRGIVCENSHIFLGSSSIAFIRFSLGQ